MRAQDVPHQHKPDNEAGLDMTAGQLKALVAFCRSLPRPQQILPTDSELRESVQRGEALFAKIGCADCHVPEIGGVDGIYTDFLLYSLEPAENASYRRELEVPLPDELPKLDEWQTPPLWGVADSAPYFHDGESPTLAAAIFRHNGAAQPVLDRFRVLSENQQNDVLEFLSSLRAPKLPPATQAESGVQ